MKPMDRTRWAISEGYIPGWGQGPKHEFESHETASLLDAGDVDTHVTVTLFFKDREPAGPHRLTVGARRTLHQRFHDLTDPEVIGSAVPVIAQEEGT
jgi:hypothetical protein